MNLNGPHGRNRPHPSLVGLAGMSQLDRGDHQGYSEERHVERINAQRTAGAVEYALADM